MSVKRIAAGMVALFLMLSPMSAQASEGGGAAAGGDPVAWQDDFAIAATAVEEAFPGAFSRAEITSEAPAAAAIHFKGEVPGGAAGLLSSLPSSIRVELRSGAGVTAAEVDEAVIRAHRAVRAQSGLVGDAVSSFDHATGMVRVVARPADPEATATERAQLVRAVRSGLPADLRERVSLAIESGVEARTEARNGGGRLEFDASGSLACTSGFNVSNSAGTTGVATAGHCSNGLTHENTSGGTEYDLTYRSGHRGDWGDFQWHTSTDTEPDNFYSSAGTVRDVAARANPVDGQTICRYGQTTGAHCNTVEDLSTCATFDGIETCRLVRMDTDEAEGGDSGGPWYSGNTAYGFHTGQVSCGFLWLSTCDVWSRATYIDDALGVTVRTS